MQVAKDIAVEFQNMNPERGRKLHHVDSSTFTRLQFQNMNPERGRKPKRTWLFIFLEVISEHEPRKGTETGIIFEECRFVFIISEHEPRKGTETTKDSRRYRPALPISEHEPRKGTETQVKTSRKLVSRNSAISEHEPRKGTETAFLLSASLKPLLLFQNMNPERGRKRYS